jgi:hypothetical protein
MFLPVPCGNLVIVEPNPRNFSRSTPCRNFTSFANNSFAFSSNRAVSALEAMAAMVPTKPAFFHMFCSSSTLAPLAGLVNIVQCSGCFGMHCTSLFLIEKAGTDAAGWLVQASM